MAERDPVCGMEVEPGEAAAIAAFEGTDHPFCSLGCLEAFEADPLKYLTAVDPVCGMKVRTDRAAAAAGYDGEDYWFCSVGCLEAFEENPAPYLAEPAPEPAVAAAAAAAKTPPAPAVAAASAPAPAPGPSPKASADGLRTGTFDVKGMHCASCVSRIEKFLRRVDGVESADVNLAANQARVAFDPARATVADLEKAVAGAGDYRLESPEAEKTILRIEGMHCASCVSRIEKTLAKVPGVREAHVNLAVKEALVLRDPTVAPLLALKKAVAAAGDYEVVDSEREPARARAEEDREARANLGKFVVAAVAAVVVMALSMRQHLGVPALADLPATPVRIGLFAITTAVLAFPGRGFFTGAWRLLLHLGADMNTLIAVGTGSAWAYSAVATFVPSAIPTTGGGAPPVYYDTAVMIVALILFGRWSRRARRGRPRRRSGA